MDSGDFGLARELYLRAVKRFREASEVSTDLREKSVQRDLANYFYNQVLSLEQTPGSEESSMQSSKPQKTVYDFSDLVRDSGVRGEVFEAVLDLALEIGREGREGRPVGTAFLVGDSRNVLLKSRQLFLNPFEHARPEDRMVSMPEIKENIKEFAQLDGVFVISGEGIVEAAGRYITIDSSRLNIPRGLGTRHAAVAAITNATRAIGIVVSQSGGVVRIFKDGRIIKTIRPG